MAQRTTKSIALFFAVGCIAYSYGCSEKPIAGEKSSAAGDGVTRVHIRLTFVQSPVEGTPRNESKRVFERATRDTLDLAVPLLPDYKGTGNRRGSLRVFRHLRDGANVLFLGECVYDPATETLEIAPHYAYLQCPDAVYANAPPFDGKPRPPLLDEFTLGGLLRLKGVRDADSMASPATLPAGSGGLVVSQVLVPSTGSEEYRVWAFSIEISSRGLIPLHNHYTWRGLNIGDSSFGMDDLMIESRRSHVTESREERKTAGTVREQQGRGDSLPAPRSPDPTP